MAKYDVIVDCSATMTLEVEAESQKDANDRVERLLAMGTGWFADDHRNDWVFVDPCVYRDNEDDEDDDE